MASSGFEDQTTFSNSAKKPGNPAEIIISAPGKVIVHGEHAVVFGKAAVATSAELKTFLRIKPISAQQVRLILPDLNLDLSWKPEDLQRLLSVKTGRGEPQSLGVLSEEEGCKLDSFARLSEAISSGPQLLAVKTFLYLCLAIPRELEDVVFPASVEVLLASQIPVSAGLGSSAAFSVCLAAAFLAYYGMVTPLGDGSWKEKQLVSGWAFRAEKIFHGTPSGIDNSISTFGGAIHFKGGQITNLVSIPPFKVILFNTEIPRSTKKMVEGVKLKYAKYEDVLRPVIEAIDAISNTFRNMVSSEEPTRDFIQELGELIDMNQHLLQVLGVSHPQLERMCQVTSARSLHSKLTGAGGGGYGFTLLPPDIGEDQLRTVQAELEELGCKTLVTTLGTPGVKRLSRSELPPFFLNHL